MTVWSGTILINAIPDDSVHEQRVEIVRSYVRHGSKSSSYYIVVAPFPPHRKNVTIGVDSDEYYRLKQTKCTLLIGDGFIGMQWFGGFAAYR